MGRRSPQINPSVAFLVGVGLMGAAASFLLLGQIESSTHPKTTGWYAAAIALLFMGLLAGLAGVIEWLRRWREDRSTPLTIEHDPDDPQCRQIRPQEGDCELRIRVRNTGRFGPTMCEPVLTLRAVIVTGSDYNTTTRLHTTVRWLRRGSVSGRLLLALLRCRVLWHEPLSVRGVRRRLPEAR